MNLDRGWFVNASRYQRDLHASLRFRVCGNAEARPERVLNAERWIFWVRVAQTHVYLCSSGPRLWFKMHLPTHTCLSSVTIPQNLLKLSVTLVPSKRTLSLVRSLLDKASSKLVVCLLALNDPALPPTGHDPVRRVPERTNSSIHFERSPLSLRFFRNAFAKLNDPTFACLPRKEFVDFRS